MARWPAQRATRKFFKGSPVENKGATRGHKGPQAGHTGPQGATSGPHRATAGPVARCGPLVAPWRTCVRVLAGNQHVLQSEHAFAYWLATSTCFKANMRSRTGWQPARASKRTCVREHAFAYWLATSTCFKANMRSRIGWQPARASKRTCVRVLAGNQHVLQSEHAFAYWLATNTSFKANMRSRPCCIFCIFSYPFPPIQC